MNLISIQQEISKMAQTEASFLVESHTKRILKKKRYATIGDGIEVKQSSIPESGNGLFATRDFNEGEIITTYDGETIDFKTAGELRKQGKASHIRTLVRMSICVDGFKDPADAHRKGGGSFCNDANYSGDTAGVSKYQNNAKFSVENSAKDPREICYIRALKDIKSGEEIFVSYGRDYWKDFKGEDSSTRVARTQTKGTEKSKPY
jgi:SET domain-containing protein